MTYALFEQAADRYDWHTPPTHYKHDHAFVLSRLPKPPCRVLDLGCGTGVFLEKAIDAGLDAMGLDASTSMVSIASKRVGRQRVRLERMQDLQESECYDGVVSLSWSFNYVASLAEAKHVLFCIFKALKPGGKLILQIAHAPNAMGALSEDRESGPNGQKNDILFLYRFSKVPDRHNELRAQYVYGCLSKRELLFEEHRLNSADARELAVEATSLGFRNVELLNSWRGEPLTESISVFLLGEK